MVAAGTVGAESGCMKNIRRILVPIDFSPASCAALDLAATLAKATDASVDVLHVWDPPGLMPAGLLAVDHDGEGPPLTVEELARDRAEVGLKDARAMLEQRHIPSHAHLGVGNPAQEIVEVADTQHFDLIVMGTRGRDGLAHLLLGSVAEKVVRHAHCPVITVRGEG
jgi:nucleotide-binding universal stress UspA family protein